MSRSAIPIYLEAGRERVFACAIDWPGWCRAAKTENLAMEALAAYTSRYAAVAKTARVEFPAGAEFRVLERLPGTATTDFGAPDAIATRDRGPVVPDEAKRLCALLSASWVLFDRVVAGAPSSLRKGPRGGGRDRDKMVDHVLGAEAAYGHKVGYRLKQAAYEDKAALASARKVILDDLRERARTGPAGPKSWPTPYAVRRLAWHVLDHAWEIEDRSEP